MTPVRLLFQPRLALLTVTLGSASAAVVAMVVVRILYTGQSHYAFLVWNLILAWMPFLLAVALEARLNSVGRFDWKCLTLAAGWLLFFPNAPYIFTDLIHLPRSVSGLFWADLMLVLTAALIGLALGLASLRLLHSWIRQACGWWAGWGFVAMVAGLAAFGVHLGRFIRMNSWDVAFAPVTLAHSVARSVLSMMVHPHQAVFPVLFAFFLFLAYAVVHVMSLMPRAQGLSVDAPGNGDAGNAEATLQASTVPVIPHCSAPLRQQASSGDVCSRADRDPLASTP